MKAILHTLTGKVASTSNADAGDEFANKTITRCILELVTQGSRELIHAPGCGCVSQGHDAVVNQR